MTIWTATFCIIKNEDLGEVENLALAFFSTYEKAVDYVKRTIGNKAELTDDGMGFYEEWRNPTAFNNLFVIVEERTVDTQ